MAARNDLISKINYIVVLKVTKFGENQLYLFEIVSRNLPGGEAFLPPTLAKIVLNNSFG